MLANVFGESPYLVIDVMLGFVSHLPRAHYFLYRLSACTSISSRAANPHPVDTVYVGIAAETLWAATLGEVLFVQ